MRYLPLLGGLLLSATPAIADFVMIDGGGYKRTLEIKSRRGDVVVVHEKLDLGNIYPASSTWAIDCSKRKMIATYKDGRQNTWRTDGKRWWSTSFALNTHKTRGYNKDVGEYFEYGCNGVIPDD